MNLLSLGLDEAHPKKRYIYIYIYMLSTGLRSWGLATSCVRPHGEESRRAKIGTHVAMQPADNTAVGNWALAQTTMHPTEATGTKTENSRTQRGREKNSAGEANAYFTTSCPERSVLNGKEKISKVLASARSRTYLL